MSTRCWLMKCEPTALTIDELARDTRTGWEGVRNVKEDTGPRRDDRDQEKEPAVGAAGHPRGGRNCDPPREARVGLTYG